MGMSKRGKGKVVEEEEEVLARTEEDLAGSSHGLEDDSKDAPVRATVANGVVKVVFKGAVSISRDMLHKRRGEEHFAYMLRNLGTHSHSAETREAKRRRS